MNIHLNRKNVNYKMYENIFNLCSNQNDCNLNHSEILIFNSQKSTLNMYLLILYLNNVLCYILLKIKNYWHLRPFFMENNLNVPLISFI